MKFKGKISWWFYGIVIGVAALLIPIIIVSAFVDPNLFALILNLVVLTSTELLCIPIVLNNYVELQDDMLLIVFGPIKKEIQYSNIISISTTNSANASLAASLDRLEIKTKGNTNVMISVIDKKSFLHKIKEYCPNIVVS